MSRLYGALMGDKYPAWLSVKLLNFCVDVINNTFNGNPVKVCSSNE